MQQRNTAETLQNYAATLPQFKFSVNSSPFCQEEIRLASALVQSAVVAATLNAQLQASQLANIELFCLLAQNAPEMLPTTWSRLFDTVVRRKELWIYPEITIGEMEDGAAVAFVPYINQMKLVIDWNDLVQSTFQNNQ